MSNFVFDTNTLISSVLSPFSTTAKSIKKAEKIGTIVYSEQTWDEFLIVLFRTKFDKYFTIDDRKEIVERLLARFKEVHVEMDIEECRDPNDNKFLELAITSSSKCMISGDQDLLIMHPFQGIPILSPTDFFNTF